MSAYAIEKEAEMKRRHFESKFDPVPMSIHTTCYKGALRSRELQDSQGNVVLAVEYDDNGKPFCAYTANAKGERTYFKEEETKNHASSNLIAERLENLAHKREEALAKEEALSAKENNQAKPKTINKTNIKLDLKQTKQRA